MSAEGWTWLTNSAKWHYFRGGRSLCGRWMRLSSADLDPELDDHPNNCTMCKRKRLAELRRKAGKED